MKLDVVVDEPGKIQRMQEAAGHRRDVEVRFFQAPHNLHYVLPFPFVMFESDGKDIIRSYGEEGEKLFYEVVGKGVP